MKNLYFLLEDNADVSVTCHDLEACKVIIESEIESLLKEDIPEFQWTITPVYLTDKEFEELGEWEG